MKATELFKDLTDNESQTTIKKAYMRVGRIARMHRAGDTTDFIARYVHLPISEVNAIIEIVDKVDASMNSLCIDE